MTNTEARAALADIFNDDLMNLPEDTPREQQKGIIIDELLSRLWAMGFKIVPLGDEDEVMHVHAI